MSWQEEVNRFDLCVGSSLAEMDLAWTSQAGSQQRESASEQLSRR